VNVVRHLEHRSGRCRGGTWAVFLPEPVRHRPYLSASVLILALWSLFFLGVLALAVGAHVSANLKLAGSLKADVVAYYLARAGTELAAMQILHHSTNWNGTADDELHSDESLFQDNDSLAGGTFSVTYAFVPEATGAVVTNYGILRESRKININSRSHAARQRLVALGVSQSVAENILNWPAAKKNELAKEAGRGYSAGYQSVHELLLVHGVTDLLFARIEPHVTIYGKSCYGGMAEGIVRSDAARGSGMIVSRRRISFVFDRSKSGFVYWHEI
jgi:hypothetical protein